MGAAAISLLLATLIAVKVKGTWSCFAFVASLLLILPLSAYTVTGLKTVLSGMSGGQVLQDCVSIATQCYTEPFKLVSPSAEGGAGLNPVFTVMGFLVIAGTVISVGAVPRLDWSSAPDPRGCYTDGQEVEEEVMATSDKSSCGMCGKRQVSAKVLKDYSTICANADLSGTIDIVVPEQRVHSCDNCGAVWLDNSSEDDMIEARCRHFSIPTPDKIKKMRDHLGLSIEEVSEAVGISIERFSGFERCLYNYTVDEANRIVATLTIKNLKKEEGEPDAQGSRMETGKRTSGE